MPSNPTAARLENIDDLWRGLEIGYLELLTLSCLKCTIKSIGKQVRRVSTWWRWYVADFTLEAAPFFAIPRNPGDPQYSKEDDR